MGKDIRLTVGVDVGDTYTHLVVLDAGLAREVPERRRLGGGAQHRARRASR